MLEISKTTLKFDDLLGELMGFSIWSYSCLSFIIVKDVKEISKGKRWKQATSFQGSSPSGLRRMHLIS